jgi:transposase
MARAHLEGGYSQAEVARHFGVHYSTVSRAARRLLDGARSRNMRQCKT